MPLPAIGAAILGFLGRTAAGAGLRRIAAGEVLGGLGGRAGAAKMAQKGATSQQVLKGAANAGKRGRAGQAAAGDRRGKVLDAVMNAFQRRGNRQEQGQAGRERGGMLDSLLSGLRRQNDQQRRQAEFQAGAATQPGLSPSQMIGMMGNSRAQIDDAQQSAQDEQQRQALEKEAKKQKKKAVSGYKKLAGGAIGATVALLTIPLATKRFGEALVESRRDLAVFNGRIAAMFAQLDVQKFRLGIRTGRETQGSTLALGQALKEFRQEFQPLHEDMRTLKNKGSEFFIRLGTEVARIANGVMELAGIRAAIERLEEGQRNFGDKGGMGHQAIKWLAGEKFVHGPKGEIGKPKPLDEIK